MQDWQFWLTLFVSILALIVAFKAKSDAKSATEYAKKTQVRNERNQFYPPLKFAMVVNNGQVQFSVKNESTSRDTTLEKVRFYVNTEVESLKGSEEYDFDVNVTLSPGKTQEISCTDFEAYLNDLKSMMFAKDPQRSNIFVRAWLHSKPALYECDTVREHLEATISHDGNGSFIISRLAN
ncbi:hypothetical protein [Vibrio parahaemolyticus]|uniref:hypothetical protein n=1 Tax=Vibrio parahaemolyticus TaxID=670 RepID=UPI000D52FFD9|nr:hypothetical protein [Vibrio parahaemolyticus]EKO5176888.1 hypothetical protein [Vibrio vulnificus]AWG78404.1 hypothetical protein C9I78_06095 [Vibrio parahaemolyticus]AWJ78033.1 hypothetical protein C7Y67_06215 [Vibrio parahaemolyticus]EGQ7850088.1 hypothetical protein [Vibrio parahaemolyticus]EID0723856.1 hypothetical protein [Vibrio parahaemolyticus]